MLFLSFKRISHYVILLIFFKGNAITQDIQTLFFKFGKSLILNFPEKVIAKFSLGSWGCPPRFSPSCPPEQDLRSCTHHTELNFSGPSTFSASTFDQNHEIRKSIQKRKAILQQFFPHPKIWLWKKKVFVKMNPWGWGIGNTIRLCMIYN